MRSTATTTLTVIGVCLLVFVGIFALAILVSEVAGAIG